jgi:hypothetical protein
MLFHCLILKNEVLATNYETLRSRKKGDRVTRRAAASAIPRAMISSRRLMGVAYGIIILKKLLPVCRFISGMEDLGAQDELIHRAALASARVQLNRYRRLNQPMRDF